MPAAKARDFSFLITALRRTAARRSFFCANHVAVHESAFAFDVVDGACSRHRGGYHDRFGSRQERFWHIASFRCAAKFGRYWGTADNGRFWPTMVCPLLTRQRHWLCTARSEERRVGKECRSRWSP